METIESSVPRTHRARIYKTLVLDVVIVSLLFLGAFFSRTIASSTFVTWDEPAWVYRSAKFLLALLRGDLGGTLLTGHPGVLTMWSGAVSLGWSTLITRTVSMAQLTALDVLPGLDVHDPEVMRQLGLLLPAAKGGIAFLHALVVVGVYALLQRLLGRRYAVAGALFLVLDPFYLALSRVLHIDALTAGLMLLSLLSALVYARDGTRRHLLLSGGAVALAALTKSYGLVAVPVVGLVLIARSLRRRTHVSEDGLPPIARAASWQWQQLVREMVLWGGVALLVFVLLWPAMWVSPVRVVREITDMLLGFSQSPGSATAEFFQGQVVADPGWIFYPVAILFRSTPLVLIGNLLALAGMLYALYTTVRLRRDDSGAERRARMVWLGMALTLAVYVVFYLAIIAFVKKKFDRYALPALLGMDLLAAMGWLAALEGLARRMGVLSNSRTGLPRAAFGGIAPLALAALLIAVQSFALLKPLYPAHYLSYFNPWMGGISRATDTVPVGWGEGVESVTDYLAARPDAESLTVATWAIAGVAPEFPGRVVKLDEQHLLYADYVLLYIGDVQTNSPLASRFYGQQEPEFVAHVNGREYAWLYPNAQRARLAAQVTALAGSRGAVVTNVPLELDQRHAGLSRYVDILAATEAEAAEQLQAATDGAPTVIYLQFNGDYDRSGQFIQRQLGQSALLLWERPFPQGTMRGYRLLEPPSFHVVEPTVDSGVSFGQELLLERYGLSAEEVQYRQELGVALDWRAMQPVSQDYHLFLHLVDEQGRIWGQGDALLVDEEAQASSTWELGTAHESRFTLALEPGIPPGQYWLEMGVYKLDDLARLPVVYAEGQSWASEYQVAPVVVSSPLIPASVRDMSIPRPLNLDLGNKVQLLGYDLPTETVESGDVVDMSLFWRCLEDIEQPYGLKVYLEQEGASESSEILDLDALDYPTDAWVPGEILRLAHRLMIPAELASGTYALYLVPCRSNGSELIRSGLLLTHLQVEHRERLLAVPDVEYPVQAILGNDEIELLGYDLPDSSVAPGDTVHLTLYWRALKRPAAAYTVFIHWLNGQGAFQGGQDSMPAMGQRPTNGWIYQEVTVDEWQILLPVDMPSGVYQIEVGMYDAQTGQRLPILLDGKRQDQDRLLIPNGLTVP